MPFRQQVASEEEFTATITKLAQEFKADVVRIRYKIKPDWQGEECIFFQVLLREVALDQVAAVIRPLYERITEEVALANVGWFPHFTCRTEVEQNALQDKNWE